MKAIASSFSFYTFENREPYLWLKALLCKTSALLSLRCLCYHTGNMKQNAVMSRFVTKNTFSSALAFRHENHIWIVSNKYDSRIARNTALNISFLSSISTRLTMHGLQILTRQYRRMTIRTIRRSMIVRTMVTKRMFITGLDPAKSAPKLLLYSTSGFGSCSSFSLKLTDMPKTSL